MEVFQRPVVADQFLSQEIEQLRVGRGTAVLTKIAGGVDNSGAKLELPDSIGDDAYRSGLLSAAIHSASASRVLFWSSEDSSDW